MYFKDSNDFLFKLLGDITTNNLKIGKGLSILLGKPFFNSHFIVLS